MNRTQFLLMKLAEECAEVSHRAIKQMQYGAEQVQKAGEVPGGQGPAPKEVGLSNSQRLTNELVDMTVMCELLEEAGQLATPPTPDAYDKAKAEKIAKLNKYLAHSRSLGVLDGDWTI